MHRTRASTRCRCSTEPARAPTSTTFPARADGSHWDRRPPRRSLGATDADMTNDAVRACIVAFTALIVAAAACGTRPPPARRLAVRYPEPRFPSYLKPPASVEDVLPHVRPLARNK